MAQFAYKSIGPNGKLTSGVLEARDAQGARAQLERQGFLPIETREVTATAKPRLGLPERGAAFASAKDLALLTQELSMLLAAGQTVEQALKLLADGAAPASLRACLRETLAHLRDGASLTESLAKTGRFPPVYRAMVQAGEASGSLAEQLAKLTSMLERAARLKDQVISALIYPAVLVTVAIGAVVLLLCLVVPQFAPLFADSPKALPLMTRLVLGASDAMREQGLTALAVASLALLGLAFSLRRPAVAAAIDDFLLRLPFVGPLLILAASGRWMRVLSVLLKGGVPLPNALELVRPVAGHRAMMAMIETMRAGIKDGKGLVGSLPPRPMMPDIALQLLKVGEQGGRLEESLGHLADLFDARLEQALKRFLAIFEPLCVLLLSLMVGSIVISILLAVVSINDLAI